jgi:hypothetical protein
MISKGLCVIFAAAILFVASREVSAQVYRCEGDSGVIYSDLPCGETAEEIQLEGIAPLSQDVVQDAGESVTGASSVPVPVAEDGGQEDLNKFLEMLQGQREYQIGELDRHLETLRAQTETKEFFQQDPASQQDIRNQIAALETNKASIQKEYEALIEEAQSRLE